MCYYRSSWRMTMEKVKQFEGVRGEKKRVQGDDRSIYLRAMLYSATDCQQEPEQMRLRNFNYQESKNT